MLVFANGAFSAALVAVTSIGCRKAVSLNLVEVCPRQAIPERQKIAQIISFILIFLAEIRVGEYPCSIPLMAEYQFLPSQVLSWAGYTGVISASLKEAPRKVRR